MSDTATIPTEDLIHDLTMSLWRSRGALRELARRKAWEPSIDDCRRIAERQVEQLKRHGVLRVERTVAPGHSMRTGCFTDCRWYHSAFTSPTSSSPAARCRSLVGTAIAHPGRHLRDE
jgi:hypothetical protein